MPGEIDHGQAMGLFLEFKRVCPLSMERFNPTPENTRRWAYHARVLGDTREYQVKALDKTPLERIAAKRRVQYFEQMPLRTKEVYIKIAACFPGVQIYACGSRVRGDYVEKDDGAAMREARRRAGKQDKVFSDFDFWAPAWAKAAYELPQSADRTRCIIPEKEKVMLPIWDFDKLPKSEHKRVIDLLNNGQYLELVQVHDQYQLSNWQYCCDTDSVARWFAQGIKEGKISATHERKRRSRNRI